MPKPTVLLVEDDADIRLGVKDLLTEQGYEVHEAGNGAQALAFLDRRRAPELILLDLLMPVMTGYEFLKALRLRGAEDLEQRIIVMSADEDAPRRMLEHDIQAFVPKPFDVPELVEAVNRGLAALA